MRKYGFLLIFFLVLFGTPKVSAQELSATDPDVVRHQVAEALREGNIDLALKGFERNSNRESIIRALDRSLLNRLAHQIENAQLYRKTENIRFYRYTWTDETGKNTIKFVMAKDDQGKWIIVSM